MLHERVGHDGLNALLRPQGTGAANSPLTRPQEQWANLMKGMPPKLLAELDAIGAEPGYDHLKGNREALALEWFARQAEARPELLTRPSMVKAMWDTVKAGVVDLMARLGLDPLKGADLDTQVMSLLQRARQSAMQGGSGPAQGGTLGQDLQFSMGGAGAPNGNGGVATQPQITPPILNKTHKNSLPIPKGRGLNNGQMQSHHGLQHEWAIHNLAEYGYKGDMAPTATLETGSGLPHSIISAEQNKRKRQRIAEGKPPWSSNLQEELGYIASDLTKAGIDKPTIQAVLEQQYRMLDKLKVPYTRIQF